MHTVIVAGGPCSAVWLKSYLDTHPYDRLIAADRGLDTLLEAGVTPDILLGDYDSVSDGGRVAAMRQRGIPVETYPAEKNFTDGEAALRAAMALGSTQITLLGATGGRLDHFLASLQGMLIPFEAGIDVSMADAQNELRLIRGSAELTREECGGRYVSLLPLAGPVTGLSMQGFKYPLKDFTLEMGSSRCVSNELAGERGVISFSGGTAVLVLSGDRP